MLENCNEIETEKFESVNNWKICRTEKSKCCLTSQHARLMSEMTAWHFGI